MQFRLHTSCLQHASLPTVISAPCQPHQRATQHSCHAPPTVLRNVVTCASEPEASTSGSLSLSAAYARPKRAVKEFDDDEDVELRAGGQLSTEGLPGIEVTAFEESRREYQIYTDAEYLPQRVVGPIEVALFEGQGRGLCVTRDVVPGDLLVVSPALGWVPGAFGQAPELEDLHMAMLEEADGARRKVLEALYDGSPESQSTPVSMATLDVKFWAGQVQSGEAGMDAERLMRVIKHCACADYAQDAAAMQVRHERPVGFVGLWPEYALLNHSCLPTVAVVVVRDRLLLHTARAMEAGEQLTRNYLGPAVMQPLAERRAAMQEFGFTCNCPRCRLEAHVSEDLQQTLQEAYDWYSQDAMPRWGAWASSGGDGDLHEVQAILDEALVLVEEVEAALEAEPELQPQEMLWLKAGAYDLYDLAVTAEEVLNDGEAHPLRTYECLGLVTVFAPGSDVHTQMASKFYELMQGQQQVALQMLEKRKRRKMSAAEQDNLDQVRVYVEEATAEFFSAFIGRYGHIQPELIEQLSEGLQLYLQGVEQLGRQAADGGGDADDQAHEVFVDGVRFSIMDSVNVSSRPASQRGGEGSVEEDGIRVSFVESPSPFSDDDDRDDVGDDYGDDEEEEEEGYSHGGYEHYGGDDVIDAEAEVLN